MTDPTTSDPTSSDPTSSEAWLSFEHHRPIEFVEAEQPAQAGFQVSAGAGGTVEVTGSCPACSGRTTTVFTVGTPEAAKGLLRRLLRPAPAPGPATPGPPPGPATVYCQCGYVHANRPADSTERGCGAYWTVPLS